MRGMSPTTRLTADERRDDVIAAAMQEFAVGGYAGTSTQAIANVRTVNEWISLQLLGQRVYALLLGIFGGIALLLAAVGIYGIMAHSVSNRTSEIGVRVALGASRAAILRLILRRGIVLVGIGMTIGVAASVALTRVVRAILFGVRPTDPAGGHTSGEAAGKTVSHRAGGSAGVLAATRQVAELPFTGMRLWIVAAAGLLLIGTGISLRRIRTADATVQSGHDHTDRTCESARRARSTVGGGSGR